MLQEKCYKNNRDGLRHRGRGSIRDINYAFQVKRKNRLEEKNFSTELAMLDGEREVAVTLTTTVSIIVIIIIILGKLCATKWNIGYALFRRSIIISDLLFAVTFETKHIPCIEV